MSAPPAPPLILASTSPQRRGILRQLGIPFDAVAPRYVEWLHARDANGARWIDGELELNARPVEWAVSSGLVTRPLPRWPGGGSASATG